MESKLDLGTAAYSQVDEVVKTNQRLLQQLNTQEHSVAEIRQLVSQITNERIDDSTEIRLPFRTDFGGTFILEKMFSLIAGPCLLT